MTREREEMVERWGEVEGEVEELEIKASQVNTRFEKSRSLQRQPSCCLTLNQTRL